MLEQFALHRVPALAWLLGIALVMALSFQDRSLWEPDEGRYSNVALNMLDSGDYLVPRRNDDSMHVTKPPVIYWTMAASVGLMGRSEWALRLPMALAFVLTVWMVYLLGRLFVPARPWLPALLYLASPLPFFAANAITTDTLLACAETAAVLAWCQHRFGRRSARWLDASWAIFGIAFMVKGPPALLPLLAILAWELRQGRRTLLTRPLGVALFVVIGFSWFAWIVHRYPQLLGYFLGHELVARVATATHDRHGQWYGGLVVYVPTLLLGAFPWLWLAAWRRWRVGSAATASPDGVFLLWWIGLPLLAFFLSRSRLPFYVLPLFVPMSLLFARILAEIPLTRGRMLGVAAWLLLLLIGKGVIASMASERDDRALALRLAPLFPAIPHEIVFVDSKARNGLRLYLGAEVERVSMVRLPMPQLPSDADFDDDLDAEIAEAEEGRYFLVPLAKSAAFAHHIERNGKLPKAWGVAAGYTLFSIGDVATD